MDKLTVISGTLFFAADVFAVASLSMPDWIITDVGGDTRLGLMWSCMTLYNRPQICYTPDLQPEWLIALACIFVGCILITVTIILLACSHWDRHVIPYARWVGFTAMVLFCLAAVIFPMGFHVDEIGGQPYQLPNSHQVGISYILFVLALWITVISELFAGKVKQFYFTTWVAPLGKMIGESLTVGAPIITIMGEYLEIMCLDKVTLTLMSTGIQGKSGKTVAFSLSYNIHNPEIN